MNPEVVLDLILDLYTQAGMLRAEVNRLKNELIEERAKHQEVET